MSEYDEHEHDHEHTHEGHDHDHDHDEPGHEGHNHDHSLIVDRLPAGSWKVDPGSSEVNFKTRSLFGLVPVTGYFDRFVGGLDVDESGAVSGSLVVATETLATGIGRRDDHLRSKDFFYSAEHPHMTFTIEKIEPSGEDHLNLSGSLQVRETAIPLSFPVYAILHGDHLHIEGRAKIDHQAAGLGWAKPGMVGKTVRADVALTLNPA